MQEHTVTDETRHGSQELEAVLDPSTTAADVGADSAYRSEEIEAVLKGRRLRSHIHRKGVRGRALGERGKQGNKTKS